MTISLCPQVFPCFSLWTPPPSAGQWQWSPAVYCRILKKGSPQTAVWGQMEAFFAARFCIICRTERLWKLSLPTFFLERK
ncbi:MAG TPA: hypothetical protein H9868_08405 [Candidatus Flavonifractor merdipullorum]|uniref:Uncharacterized protein n=1 Tax=Candidatus Flavonifractor merdipullorum TaxID=2838590 RepID=A0A9D1RVT6_9FIRM|nr:hypothetical protein [Candidatus Flavonifractor merdipullorum]